jgi:predicted small secreted protein
MRRRARIAAVLLAAALTLSGCAGAPAPGQDLRTLVVETAEHAAGGDWAAASAAIDDLEARVIAARDAEGLSAADAEEILATIAAVRADLAALAAPPASEDPVVPAEEQTPAVDTGTTEQPADDGDDADDGEDGSGNDGNGGGKGNDKGGENGKGGKGKD